MHCNHRFVTACLAAWLCTLGVAFTSRALFACDICAVYTATELQESRTGARIGVAEQFTRFGTLQRDGKEVDNPNDEWLDSSITQLIAGYHVHPRLGFQGNLPVIARHFRRVADGGVERSSETGIGDLSLHVVANVLSTVNPQSLQRAGLSLGIKLPTGSPERLAEENKSAHSDHPKHIPPVFRSPRLWPRHAAGPDSGRASGVHGHGLALGTGSTDVILGAQWVGTYRRLYGTFAAQYFVRTRGSYGYTYANETILSAGPGAFAWLDHRSSLGIQFHCALNTKGTDARRGVRVADTGATFVYVGPAVHWTWKTSVSADLALDLPVVRHTTALQIVPDFRVRGGFMWRF